MIDATVDGGGHGIAMLKRIKPAGRLLGLEWDPQIYAGLKMKLEGLGFAEEAVLANESYTSLKIVAEKNDFMGADAILFDLGMSSWHIEESGRGFSFQRDEPLDMRFNPLNGQSLTAAEVVNKYSPEKLVEVLKNLGEERFARRIAEKIVSARREKPIMTTFQLVEVIKNAVPFWYRRSRIHFATRTFQALRIKVNEELENIQKGLAQAENTLKKGGRLAVISFHSLEDRIVKNFFREEEKIGNLKITSRKPIIAKQNEVEENPRSRSAKLRIAQKV